MAITVQGPTGVFQPSYPDIIDKYGVVTKSLTTSFKEYFTSSGSGPTGPTDPYWPFVSMLLHGDGVNAAQNNTFVDGSTNNFTVTRNGNTTQGSFNPFTPVYPYDVAVNGGSGYFDGTGDYLTIPASTPLNIPTGAFTVEMWIYRSGNGAGSSNYDTLMGSPIGVGSTNWGVYVNKNTLAIAFFTNVGGIIETSTAIANATWTHVAVSRTVGNNLQIFINGVSGYSAAYTGTAVLVNPLYIAFDTNNNNYYGYISNLRYVNGTTLYTANFTPPTAPLTAITNTSLLLGFTNGAIFDNAILNNLETLNSAQISTSVFKYGTGSIRTNSGNSYLSTPMKNQLQLSGDFTVECWAYVVNDSAYATLLDCSAAGGYNGWFFEYSTTRGLVFATGSSGVSYTTTPALNTWTHLAATRQSGTIRLFINGTLVSSGSVPGYADAGLPLLIGAANGYTTIWYFDGYLDDIRITKGIARYTATFTPPDAAFPNQAPTYPSGTATQRAIFGLGWSTTNIVSNIGVVSGDTTGVGTLRTTTAGASYGGDKAIFGYGSNGPTFYNISNKVSNTGVVATDTAGVGTGRLGAGAAKYGTDKAIFGYGGNNYSVSFYSMTNLVSNAGVVATDTTGVGTARVYLAAVDYGTDKAMFGYGATVLAAPSVSITNLVSNTGVVSTDTTGVGTARQLLAAAGYGSTGQAMFGYGGYTVYYSMTNLVSNTGVVATDTTGVGTARSGLAASGYGGDKAIFGYGYNGSVLSMTNLVSNTGVVATDTAGVGTVKYQFAAAGFSFS
jgi:hypothetical protein